MVVVLDSSVLHHLLLPDLQALGVSRVMVNERTLWDEARQE